MNYIINCIFLQFIHFIGTWRLYKKAGHSFWKALFPIYSILVILKIINRPTWWIILFFIPVISVIMYGILWVEFIFFFYKQKKKEKILVLITFGFYIMYINYIPNIKFRKIITHNHLNKDLTIIESIILTTCLHVYFIQPFIVHSSSMERTLLIGDFIFVSKIHYGLHIPISLLKMPTLTMLKKDEIVAFNSPYDGKDFYIKRCIALPGDKLEIKEGQLYINCIKDNKRIEKQFSYIIRTKNIPLNKKFINNIWNINDIIYLKYEQKNNNKIYLYHIFLTKKYAKALNALKTIRLTKYFFTKKDYNIFPKIYRWNLDNYGPIYVPKQGDIVYLSLKNFYKYKNIIFHYENNAFTMHNKKFFINGKKTKKYYINKNYYFMLGDNRHNSLDSRYWGFIPDNYIFGKPIFLLFSIYWDKKNPLYFFKWKLRCNRITTFFD